MDCGLGNGSGKWCHARLEALYEAQQSLVSGCNLRETIHTPKFRFVHSKSIC